MERLTKTGDKDLYVVDDLHIQHDTIGYSGEAISKLAKFENMYEDLLTQQSKISQEMEKLRLEGKTHSVKFKQLFTNKLTNNNIFIMLKTYGLHE